VLVGLLCAAAGCRDPLAGDACSPGAPGASWVAFSSRRSGAYDLYAVRADGTCTTRLTTGAGALLATWSPDGTLAYLRQGAGANAVWRLDLASGAEAPLELGGLPVTSPAYSPDGAWLALESPAAGPTQASDLWLAPTAGGQPARLTSGQAAGGGPAVDAGPAWAPDGLTIYFVSNRTGAYEVWSVAAAGGEAHQVTTGARILGKPAVSPDGGALAYARPAAGDAFTEVVLLDLATGTSRVLSSQADREPAFDPAGGRVVVTSSRTGDPELWLLDLATGAPLRQLTRAPGTDGAAVFAPGPPAAGLAAPPRHDQPPGGGAGDRRGGGAAPARRVRQGDAGIEQDLPSGLAGYNPSAASAQSRCMSTEPGPSGWSPSASRAGWALNHP